ncbi:hypothetical protein D3876_11075 [Sphingomonas cavernae]|uniref:Uncharacterized protein n=2 Tax=Sphingomonas cavernae TaxID=2320861 RepID=A0A418WL30_9SPHN|nr:hypothetical protein D3876_11075 [Sphingomonas cavernae]
MRGKARNSPTSRGIVDVASRELRLQRFEIWGAVTAIDLPAIAGVDLWNSYWEKLAQIEGMMRDAQASATIIRTKIQSALNKDGDPA